MLTDLPGHLPGMTTTVLRTESASDELAERVDSGFFQQAYYDHLDPVLQDNAQIESVLTILGACLIAVQVVALIRTFSKHGLRISLVAPLVGGVLMSAMLIMPTTMMPFMLGILDWIISLFISLVPTGGS